MSNYSINSINGYSNLNATYLDSNSTIKTNSPSGLFDNILGNVANVPTGRQSRYNNYNTSQTCAIHGKSSSTYNTLSSSVSNTSSRDVQTKKAIEIAKSYLGGKYVWGATGPNAFDCSGFTQYIYKKAYGKNIPRVSYEQAKHGQKVEKKDLQPGDLVFFDTMNKGRVSHVGIYIGNNKFIHAASSKSGIIESELSGYYAKKYRGARRP